MAGNQINRRDFVTAAHWQRALSPRSAEAQTRVPSKGRAPPQTKAPSTRSILNYNENMEYRKRKNGGLMVSAISWEATGSGSKSSRKGGSRALFRQRLFLSQDSRIPAVAGRVLSTASTWASIIWMPWRRRRSWCTARCSRAPG